MKKKIAMKTKMNSKNAGSLLKSNNLKSLGKSELQKIFGGGWVIEYYIEDGTVKQRLVYK